MLQCMLYLAVMVACSSPPLPNPRRPQLHAALPGTHAHTMPRPEMHITHCCTARLRRPSGRLPPPRHRAAAGLCGAAWRPECRHHWQGAAADGLWGSGATRRPDERSAAAVHCPRRAAVPLPADQPRAAPGAGAPAHPAAHLWRQGGGLPGGLGLACWWSANNCFWQSCELQGGVIASDSASHSSSASPPPCRATAPRSCCAETQRRRQRCAASCETTLECTACPSRCPPRGAAPQRRMPMAAAAAAAGTEAARRQAAVCSSHWQADDSAVQLSVTGRRDFDCTC